jgi:hypothetical protein
MIDACYVTACATDLGSVLACPGGVGDGLPCGCHWLAFRLGGGRSPRRGLQGTNCPGVAGVIFQDLVIVWACNDVAARWDNSGCGPVCVFDWMNVHCVSLGCCHAFSLA